MNKILFVCALLLHLGHARRVQHDAVRLNSEGEASEQLEQVGESDPSAQSFVEVKAGYLPSSVRVPRIPHLSHLPKPKMPVPSGVRMHRASHVTMQSEVQAPPPAGFEWSEVPGLGPDGQKKKEAAEKDKAAPEKEAAEAKKDDSRAAPVEMIAEEKKGGAPTKEEAAPAIKENAQASSIGMTATEEATGIKAVAVVEAAKQPWYANLRLNLLVLLVAKIGARIALKFKNKMSFGSGDATRRAGEVAMSAGDEKKGFLSGVDVPLLVCFALWYLGNYYYNITNKLALNAAGGAAGFPMTIATLQLGVGVIYALFLWLAPDARKKPTITFEDYKATLPVGFTAAGAHAASVFALSAGAVSFAQIVKAAEPAFAAVLGSLFYGASVSTAKWLCLIPVIGGVILASLGELSFAWAALGTAAIANVFAAVKANENKKLMETPGLKDRLGSVGNQFALTSINAFLFCLPVMFLTEGRKLGAFWELCKTTPVVLNNMIFSGLWFYLYNELATLTIKKTNAVTQSVANTAKRVIVIIVVALVMGESLGALKLIGCGIGIGGVFLYSVIDKLVAKKDPPPAVASS